MDSGELRSFDDNASSLCQEYSVITSHRVNE